MHALVFAGSITTLLLIVVLYSQYGFWHEKYVRQDSVLVDDPLEVESPASFFSKFFEEASVRFSNVKDNAGTFLEGKDSYSNEQN